MADKDTKMLTVSQAAHVLGVHPNTLRKWDRLGQLKSGRLPSGHRRYPAAEIERIKSEIESGQFVPEAPLVTRRPTAADAE